MQLKTMITRRDTIARPLTIITLFCIAFTFAAPFSSSVYTEHIYNYEVNVASGQNGFKFKAKASLEVLYAEPAGRGDDGLAYDSSMMVRLHLTEPQFFDMNQQPLGIDHKHKTIYSPDYDLYAHVVILSNGTAYVRQLYTHQADATTFRNIKKSILINLLPTNHHQHGPRILQNSQQESTNNILSLPEEISLQPICTHDNNQEQPELFSPDSISQVNIIAKAPKKPILSSSSSTSPTNNLIDTQALKLFELIDGYQNVTFKSRVFSEAESNLSTSFQLKLVESRNSQAHEKFDQAESINGAIRLLDMKTYQPDSVQLERERRICSNHHCGLTLQQLFQDFRETMTDESMASVEAAVNFLRMVNRLRDPRGANQAQILAILKKARGNQGIESTFLDILAAARTKESISAAFKHLRLAKNNNLSTAERFLSSLSVTAKTTAKMHLKRNLQSPYYFTPTAALKLGKQAKSEQAELASLEYISKELLTILEQTAAKKWASHKLRWSSLLTLATLVNAYNQEKNYESIHDELNQKVTALLANELKSCPAADTDCRIVALQAIGNIGHLGESQFHLLKEQVLNSGRRESVSAMKILRDLLQNQPKDKPLSQSFFTSLKDLLLRIAYDSSQETTARVLAAEMIVRFVPNSLASEELLRHLPSFGNNELATMIYSRMQSLRPDSLARHHENWYWKSCIINGTSTSFVRTMAKTDSLNASYGVNVELLNSGKVFKESSFDVFLDTKQRTQDLFSLGIFARGLSGLTGSGDGENGDENESTTAGMTLRLLGGYLRPYVFFTSTGELFSHIWSGTASEPTTAFNGDLLLIDHDEGYPLISGFVAEQQMRGVLSIDVSGKVKVSWLWSKSSHAVVRTKASVIVQASQSVFTSYDNFWHSHLFSFGGEASIDFIADNSFSPMPVKTCLQVTQPEFILRYNSRRHDQTMTDEVRRKLTRKTYSIGAKSYPLNTENNKMCSMLMDEL